MSTGDYRAAILLFPYVANDHVVLETRGRRLAIVDFPAMPPRVCALQSSEPDVTIVRCGALLVVDLDAHLQIAPEDVEIVDGEVVDAGGRHLGFFLEQITKGDRGLVIRLAFYRPTGAALTISLFRVLRTDGRYEEAPRRWQVELR